MRLRWTEPALSDLDHLEQFIAQDSPVYARRFVLQLLNAAQRLITFPQSGRYVPESQREDVREVIYCGYRIVYWIVEDDTIDILAVMHGSRDLSDPNFQPWKET